MREAGVARAAALKAATAGRADELQALEANLMAAAATQVLFALSWCCWRWVSRATAEFVTRIGFLLSLSPVLGYLGSNVDED